MGLQGDLDNNSPFSTRVFRIGTDHLTWKRRGVWFFSKKIF